MIDNKYLELIHKDIDKEISPSEKELLDKYLQNNPEANELYQDLLKTELSLNFLPERVPSEDIKKNILNSIDISRYAVKKKSLFALRPSFLRSTPKSGLAISFSFGIIAGIVILSLIFAPELRKLSNDQSVYGTIGLTNGVLVESFPVKTVDISGKIDIFKNSENYGFYVDLRSTGEYILQLEYDYKKLDIEDFSAQSKNVLLEKEDGFIRISSQDLHRYSLLLSKGTSSAEDFTIKIIKNGNSSFEREISIKE